MEQEGLGDDGAELIFITHQAPRGRRPGHAARPARARRRAPGRQRASACSATTPTRSSGADEVRQHPGRGARARASPTSCSPAWPRDGGLYVPETWPALGPARWRAAPTRPYADVAVEVMWPFVEGEHRPRRRSPRWSPTPTPPSTTPTWCPLRRPRRRPAGWLELFHGPTLAFKDVALQLVGRLFDHELTGAASGSRSSAPPRATPARRPSRPAATATRIDIVILHPAGRVSRGAAPADDHGRRAQRPQPRRRGHVRRLPGPGEGAVRRRARSATGVHLSAVNSINWARVMAQIVYYVTAAARLGRRRRPVPFCGAHRQLRQRVRRLRSPSAWALPIAQFVVGSNRNDILTRFLATGGDGDGRAS